MTLVLAVSLVFTGLVVGTLAGILGLGGGVFLVPVLVAFGYPPLNAVATSSIPVLVAAVSGVSAHIRSKQLRLVRALRIGVIAAAAAQVGVFLAHHVNSRLLLILFACFLLANISLMRLRRSVSKKTAPKEGWEFVWSEIFIGALGGVFSGFFGVGGGVIMVPLLVLLVAEPLKDAVRTSMAVVLVSAISSSIGHALKGSVLWDVGLLLAAGSLVGAQLGVMLLPKLSEKMVRKIFVGMLSLLACYVFVKALIM